MVVLAFIVVREVCDGIIYDEALLTVEKKKLTDESFSREFYVLSYSKRALFPLDGGRWLGGDVIAHAVYAAHLVDDVVAHLGHEVVGQSGPVGGHCIG